MRRRRFVWPIGGFDRFDGMNGKNGKYRRQFRQFRERFLPCSRRTGDDGFAVARHIGRHRNESVRVQCFRKRRKHRIVAVGRFDEKLRFRQLGAFSFHGKNGFAADVFFDGKITQETKPLAVHAACHQGE